MGYSEITDEVLQEFKERMKISHSAEDGNLTRILSASLAALNHECGTFSFDNEVGKELVFERSRYVYNDSLEYFMDNFLGEMLALSLSLGIAEEKAKGEQNGEGI